MIMYYYENNNDNKFILMWFIDVSDNVWHSKDGEKDSDENDSSCLFDDPGKSFFILQNYQNCMRYDVNCSISWYHLFVCFCDVTCMLHILSYFKLSCNYVT